MNNQPLSIFAFPVWWYSEGLQLAWSHAKERYRYVLRSTGLLIFLKNIAQPLYGDTTRQGRAISAFIRVILLVFILAWTVIRLGYVAALFFVHLLALPFAIIMIVYQLFSLFL
ncbi:MAG: hypothetical protein JNK33_03235 [Candidatus Doudnabacteria bacterium]|nr:hypothetical protein [Candidatus Doudnabacteria bacterium]